jgi:ABC-type polar amino acid transport system ATPase subunit
VDTLDLLTELKRRVEMPPGKNIILIGPPGSGKGTQVRPARQLHRLHRLCTL